MDRSDGSFLWVRLVINGKRKASEPREIIESLESIPKGMNSLYKRIIEELENKIPASPKPTPKAVINWIVHSNLTLSTDDLEADILLDVEEEIYAGRMWNLSRNLMYIDQGKRMRTAHRTVR